MGDLVLNSLEIQGFRGFRHLQIEKLGRVNLIVGKNNVGKSSLLEALQIYAKRADPTLIRSFLRSRDEDRLEYANPLSSFKYLFYGRNIISPYTNPIYIGAMNSPENKLSIAIKWYAQVSSNEQGILKRVVLSPEDYEIVDNSSPRLTIQLGHTSPVNYSLNESDPITIRAKTEWKEINSIYAKTNLLKKAEIGELWDNIALTGLDEEVIKALRIVAPGVEGLTLVDDIRFAQQEIVDNIRFVRQERERIPVVKIKGIGERLPLSHLGDGMQRMLSIALALVNSRDGILFIDEIENGLHYLIQSDLWRLIFRLAHQLNVQVFATTHSWDCIKAFREAPPENQDEEKMLIRLENKEGGDIKATLFDERRLSIATDEEIEIR